MLFESMKSNILQSLRKSAIELISSWWLYVIKLQLFSEHFKYVYPSQIVIRCASCERAALSRLTCYDKSLGPLSIPPFLYFANKSTYMQGIHMARNNPYPEPVVFQWQSSGNPVCLELRPQCTLECHWRNASVLPVVFQWLSSGLPVCSNYAN